MNEQKAWKFNGFVALLAILIVIGGSVYIIISGASQREISGAIIVSTIISLIALLFASGLMVVQPNQAVAVTFFGRYLGSVRDSGIWMVVPFSARKKVSLRVRNFNSARLKVNDVEGNPIEIAAVVVFKVTDSYRALFEVDSYEQFVEIQSETALRHVASKYPYDIFDETGYSLRGNADRVARELGRELQERLSAAGVEVVEARLTHLAYATEIAGAMLQRQQATAILAARQIIVEGAVGMAQMAIAQLQREGIVELDEERKVSMINNLMVTIVSDRAAQPVINTGSLY